MSTTEGGWARKPSRARFGGGGGAGSSAGGLGPSPAKKKKKTQQSVMERVAPQATLDGLPDNILLLVMNYLNLLSLIRLTLVCRRFYLLSRDRTVWEAVELTRDSVERKPSTQLLKKLIRLYLTPSLEHVVLEECHPKGNVAVTEATVDLLFTSCPLIESVTLVNCDMRKFSPCCLLFTSEHLRSVRLRGCELSMDWTGLLKPTWPKLERLSLENCAKTNNRDVQYIVGRSEWQSSLRYLNMRGCYRISPEAIQLIGTSLSALKSLDVRNCKLTLKEDILTLLEAKDIRLLI